MTKQDLATLLRSVGCNENTITAMENAFDMGVAYEREACAEIVDHICKEGGGTYGDAIRARGEA